MGRYLDATKVQRHSLCTGMIYIALVDATLYIPGHTALDGQTREAAFKNLAATVPSLMRVTVNLRDIQLGKINNKL